MRLTVLWAEEEATLWYAVNNKGDATTADNGLIARRERWSPPLAGSIKCNMHTNWRNSLLHSGAAWIARDCAGNVKFHAGEALTPSPSKFFSELRGIIWVLQSARDLWIMYLVLASDHHDTIEAISHPNQWPRYRNLLEQIHSLRTCFNSLQFEVEKIECNLIARDIAKSVLHDGRFQSYLALGGPAWLHERLNREATGDNY